VAAHELYINDEYRQEPADNDVFRVMWWCLGNVGCFHRFGLSVLDFHDFLQKPSELTRTWTMQQRTQAQSRLPAYGGMLPWTIWPATSFYGRADVHIRLHSSTSPRLGRALDKSDQIRYPRFYCTATITG